MPKGFLKFSIIAAFCLSALPLVSLAQIDQFSLSNELNIELSPEYPGPNQQVSVSLTMYTEDLDSATVSWFKNGKQILSGRGETRYSFQTGAAGEETKIDIQIKFLNGASLSKSFVINPASVDLVWEADSYVPPFYKGKALHPRQGKLKIAAMPEFVRGGKRISPQNLIYKWANDVSAYESQSGYGKNVLILNGSVLGRSESIEVSVTDPESNMTAYGYIKIAPSDPQIVFYEKSPYYGPLFEEAISSPYQLKTDEVQLIAAPYFFTNEKGGWLKFEWRLNNMASPSLSGSRTAIFKKPEGEAGKSTIALKVENTNRILQQSDKSITVDFSN